MKKKEEMKVKVDVEEPKDKKEETAEKLPKPTVKELQQQLKLVFQVLLRWANTVFLPAR